MVRDHGNIGLGEDEDLEVDGEGTGKGMEGGIVLDGSGLLGDGNPAIIHTELVAPRSFILEAGIEFPQIRRLEFVADDRVDDACLDLGKDIINAGLR